MAGSDGDVQSQKCIREHPVELDHMEIHELLLLSKYQW